MFKRLMLTAICLTVVMTGGCATGNNTSVIQPPAAPLNTEVGKPIPTDSEGLYVGTAIYPARYEVGNPLGYTKGLTLDLTFEVYNGLPYSVPANLNILAPSASTMAKRPGFVIWDKTPFYVSIVDDGSYIPAYGKKEVIVRILVPEDEPYNPAKWVFHLSYLNVGQLWGDSVLTAEGNRIFYPGGFNTSGLTDTSQELTYIANGNSPRLMVRASYDAPPETTTDGELVYLGLGEQIIRKWDKGDGTILDRQYTLFTIEDYEQLTPYGTDKLFYRAWIERRDNNGNSTGEWDELGRTLTVAQVMAEVQVNMK